jgi:hypothetical protein
MPQPVDELFLANISFIKKLVSTKSEKKRKRLLRLATDDQLFAIRDSAWNITNKYFNYTTRQAKRAIKHREFIQRLAKARANTGIKKVIQRGGGFGALAAVITPILIEAYHLIKNNGQ